MLTSVVFGLYPLVLPASTNPAYSLTVDNAKAGDYGLRIGLAWWIIGMILVAGYTITCLPQLCRQGKNRGQRERVIKSTGISGKAATVAEKTRQSGIENCRGLAS